MPETPRHRERDHVGHFYERRCVSDFPVNPQTKNLDLRGFDSSRSLLREGIPVSLGGLPEIQTQRFLVCRFLACKLAAWWDPPFRIPLREDGETCVKSGSTSAKRFQGPRPNSSKFMS